LICSFKKKKKKKSKREEEEEQFFDYTTLLQLRDGIKMCFGMMIEFIEELSIVNSQGEKDLINHPLIIATLRIFSAWLAGETEAHQEPIIKIIPFLIEISANQFLFLSFFFFQNVFSFINYPFK